MNSAAVIFHTQQFLIIFVISDLGTSHHITMLHFLTWDALFVRGQHFGEFRTTVGGLHWIQWSKCERYLRLRILRSFLSHWNRTGHYSNLCMNGLRSPVSVWVSQCTPRSSVKRNVRDEMSVRFTSCIMSDKFSRNWQKKVC